MAGRVNCREASRLLSASQERALTLGENVAVKLHLVACGMCRNSGRAFSLSKANGMNPENPPVRSCNSRNRCR